VTADSGLLTPQEVAVMFRADPKTVTRWGQAGRLESVRTPGNHRRYFAVQVRALLAGASTEEARKLALAEKERLTGGAG
jgi:excisionase family DNA binding protein